MRFGRHDAKTDALAEVPLFRGLSRGDLENVARHVDETTVSAGEHLATQGRRGQQLMLILDGQARVERDGTQLAQLGPDDVVGEMSLIDNEPGSATVTAETDCRVLVMHAQDFSTLLDEVPGFGKQILRTLSGRLRAADARLV